MADHRPSARSSTHPTPPPHSPSASFAGLGVPGPLVAALADAGITRPFPIQAATLRDSLAGRDVLGRGRTGSGKTYAFVLPLLARLAASSGPSVARRPRGLILVPTRELATQIQASLAPLARALSLRSTTVFGGVKPASQIQALRSGVDIVIACPGRLEDLIRGGHANLGSIEVTVLDEADHMADLGFLPGVRRILDATPRGGQRLLFSATLDAGVDVLVQRYLHDPAVHSVDSARSPVGTMSHHVLHVDQTDRLEVIADLAAAPGRTLVFTRTKRGAKTLARQLSARGVPAVELHGNLSQGARTRNLAAFAGGHASALVATDIAARGIHVDEVGLVVHADPPVEHKAYLHRSGRTARAGASGTVVTMMLDAQVPAVRDLTRQAGIKPTLTRVTAGHSLLREIAPGERTYLALEDRPTAPDGQAVDGSRPGGSRRRGAASRSDATRSAGRRPGTGGTRGAGAETSGTRRSGRGRGTGSTRASGRPHSAAAFSSGARGR